MKKYKNIKEALDQLRKCNFTDDIGHPIENNIAFIYLEELSEKFKFLPGDKIEVEVHGRIAGVETSVCKEGYVNSIEVYYEQPDGNTSAKYIYEASIYDDDCIYRNKDKVSPFKKERLWVSK